VKANQLTRKTKIIHCNNVRKWHKITGRLMSALPPIAVLVVIHTNGCFPPNPADQKADLMFASRILRPSVVVFQSLNLYTGKFPFAKPSMLHAHRSPAQSFCFISKSEGFTLRTRASFSTTSMLAA